MLHEPLFLVAVVVAGFVAAAIGSGVGEIARLRREVERLKADNSDLHRVANDVLCRESAARAMVEKAQAAREDQGWRKAIADGMSAITRG
jgi:hypothetical protein